MNRHDRSAADERRQHVVRRVKERHAFALQRQRDLQLLGDRIVAGRLGDRPEVLAERRRASRDRPAGRAGRTRCRGRAAPAAAAGCGCRCRCRSRAACGRRCRSARRDHRQGRKGRCRPGSRRVVDEGREAATTAPSLDSRAGAAGESRGAMSREDIGPTAPDFLGPDDAAARTSSPRGGNPRTSRRSPGGNGALHQSRWSNSANQLAIERAARSVP